MFTRAWWEIKMSMEKHLKVREAVGHGNMTWTIGAVSVLAVMNLQFCNVFHRTRNVPFTFYPTFLS
jgi:hypothetical protein